MDAGRDFDKFIAEHVMGLVDVKFADYQSNRDYRGHWELDLVYQPYSESQDYYEPVPHYSTDIASAFCFFSQRFQRFAVIKSEMPDRYYAEIICHLGMGSFELYKADAETAAHAMCLAAKKFQEHDFDVV